MVDRDEGFKLWIFEKQKYDTMLNNYIVKPKNLDLRTKYIDQHVY